MENIKKENLISIDVIIPVYNQGAFILEAIKSIERQTLKPKNIFIINDGSTDNTESVVLNYKDRSIIPITYIKKINAGPNSARNIGVKNSKADFLAFLDADDVWTEYKLEEQINIFTTSSFENLGLVYGRYDTIDINGKKSKDNVIEIDPRYRGKAYNVLMEGNKILGSASCVMIKNEVFRNVGLFNENLRFAEDWEMWLRISEKYSIDYSEKVLVHIRRHPFNTSKNRLKQFIGLSKFYLELLYKTKNPLLLIKLIFRKII
ncbi:glycosyltransferase family 2 protein [Candidatus Nomurabacteria bacterium]|nr:glycosyltransferase family 2 protein [Candidatus Nomurabacteria bacterium]